MGAFDLLYFTHDDNELDRTYFARLSNLAARSEYLHMRRRSPDVINHLIALWHARSAKFLRRREEIYLASIDSLLFRYVLKTNPEAVVYGFDDGAGNIAPESVYRVERYTKAALYAALLGVPDSVHIKRRIRRHFSIYPDFENIVSNERITYLSLFEAALEQQTAGKVTFFVGQPFSEYLGAKERERLARWVRSQQVDYYVLHPREDEPLLSGIPILDKKGELAEDAILAAATGARPIIISGFSSVLFNVSSCVADKIYVSLGSGELEARHRRLAQQAGASVVAVSGDAR